MWRLEYFIWPVVHSLFNALYKHRQAEIVPRSPTEGGKGVDGVDFFAISLLCPWLCANMGVQQLSWCRYMYNRGEADESGVCVGAEGLTGCVNRAWLPWELMAIDHPRPRNDRSYLGLALAMWNVCLCVHECVCAVPTACFKQSLLKLPGEGVQVFTMCEWHTATILFVLSLW